MMKKITKLLAPLFYLILPFVVLAQEGWVVDNLADSGLPGGTIRGIIVNILDWLLGLIGVFGIIGFVISGILYLVSAGDEDTITKAKAAMKYSIIGVIVGLAGFVIIQAINSMLWEDSAF